MAATSVRKFWPGFDYASLSRKPTSVMQGVAYSPDINIDMLFVTLKKSESDFYPTTMYRDYPIDAQTFHWESQSTTSVASPTGQRYFTGSSSVLLFVRTNRRTNSAPRPTSSSACLLRRPHR